MAMAKLFDDDGGGWQPPPGATAQSVYAPTGQYTGGYPGQPGYTGNTGIVPPNFPSAAQTPSGDWGADFLKLAGGYSPSAKNLEQFFPQFQEMYPGFQLKKNASGYADSVIAPNQQIFDTQQNSGYDKSDAWQWNLAGGPGFTPSAYSAQFSDPLTQQYEQLLKSQTGLYQQQQQAMQQAAQQKASVQAQTDAAVKQLMAYLQEQVGKLGQPAYTDSEANILKTRLLDPIEQDRGASRKRAFENIGSRGFDPSSGIAQELLRLVDQGYDQQRTTAHSDVAYRQIQEQRSRDQEKQKLLQYLTQLPQAAATGDLNFLQLLDSMINQPGQNALATSAMLADLPKQAVQLGAQVLGLGGSPQSSVPGMLSLLQNTQQNSYIKQQQMADYWKNLGLGFLG